MSAAEPPRVHAPLPTVGAPAHVHDAVGQVEKVRVAVVEEVSLLAVGLLPDHLLDTCAEYSSVCEVMRRRQFRLDVLIVHVLDQIVGTERELAEVGHRFGLREHARVELAPHVEALAGLEERVRVVTVDSRQLDARFHELELRRDVSRQLVDRADDRRLDPFPQKRELAEKAVTSFPVEGSELVRDNAIEDGLDLTLLVSRDVHARHERTPAQLSRQGLATVSHETSYLRPEPTPHRTRLMTDPYVKGLFFCYSRYTILCHLSSFQPLYKYPLHPW